MSGEAYAVSGRVIITYNEDAFPIELLTTVLHEIVHVAHNLPADGEEYEDHNLIFKHTLASAANEAFGVCVSPDEQEIYGTDARIAQAIFEHIRRGHLRVGDKYHKMHLSAEKEESWRKSLLIIYEEELMGSIRPSSVMSSNWLITP